MQDSPKNVVQFLETWALFAVKLQFSLSYIGVCLNFLHILILSNKRLKSQFVNVLLVGIAISDFIFLIYYFDAGVREFLQAGVPIECRPPKSLFAVYWTQILEILRDIFQRVSAYLGVFLALIRYMVMKSVTNNRIFLTSSACWKLFILLILISSVISFFFSLKLNIEPSGSWHPPSSCTMYLKNSSFPVFGRAVTTINVNYPEMFKVLTLFDGILKILPSITYIFLATGLVLEVKKAEKLRKLFTKKDEMSNVTSLIILMTISYFLAETPWAIVRFLQLCGIGYNDGLRGVLFELCAVITYTFLILNSSIHCFFCFFLSSEYRLIFWSMIRCKKINSEINVPSLRNLSST